MITFLLCISFMYLIQAEGCGTVTHRVISGRAKEFYNANGKYSNYRQLLDKHKDAFEAGTAYPDSYYWGGCFNGKYRNISEDTHWTPFINASVNYIRRKYPHPWNLETEKLVVFLFGIMSHQVSDIVWHSLGVEQGFLSTMAKVNFHDDYGTAHTFGDLGGEFISFIDLNADLVVDLTKWYVPTLDLFNIYQELYGATKISLVDIEFCSMLEFIEGFAVYLSRHEVYPGIIDISPFLAQNMENYFIGGLNDMVGWTHRGWNNVVTMLERGTDVCHLPYNPVFVTCNSSQPIKTTADEKLRNGYYVDYNRQGLSVKDVDVKRTSRGIIIQPGESLKVKIRQYNQHKEEIKRQSYMGKKQEPKSTISTGKIMVNGSYARLGWSISSGDVDGDGYTDIIIGSPGYSHVNNWQRGRVYIIYGSETNPALFESADINLDDQNLKFNTTYIDGPDQMQSGFGSSVTILDINLDGIDDIAVGSPAYWNTFPLDYHGLISIFIGQKGHRSFSKPDVIITCKTKYCNLGHTLASADVRNNGYLDLIIGTPYFHSSYDQEGIVSALFSSKDIKASQSYEFEKLIQKWKLKPEKQQLYAWFGHNVKAKDTVVIVNSPCYRKCYFTNCSYSQYDKQCVGQSHVFSYWSHLSDFTITGTEQYQLSGFDMDFGFPYDTSSWNSLIIAYSIPGNTVIGKLNGFDEKIYRAGSVLMVNYTNNMSHVMAQFDGNRNHASFGYVTQLSDINNDGIADLIISERNRVENRSEIIQNKSGTLYVFYGGKHMPTGKATFTSKCNEEQPCSSKVANFTSSTFGEQSKNGYKIHTVTTKQGTLLLSSDITSDVGLYNKGAGRRSGVVWRFNFKH